MVRREDASDLLRLVCLIWRRSPDRKGKDAFLLSQVEVELKSGEKQDYFIPMATSTEESEALLPYALARIRRGPRTGLLYGAGEAPEFALTVVEAMRQGKTYQHQ